MLSRRAVLTGASAALLSVPLSTAALPQAAEDDPYPLPPFDYSKLPPAFRPTTVAYTGRQWPGTVIVDTPNRQIYLVLQGGKAMRWGCAVGKDGFRWAGLADIGRKVMWPTWTPPKEMIARHPEKAKWANGMPAVRTIRPAQVRPFCSKTARTHCTASTEQRRRWRSEPMPRRVASPWFTRT